ncbi:hypothetical protein Tco_0283497, partial [Tanacetum coccineum]
LGGTGKTLLGTGTALLGTGTALLGTGTALLGTGKALREIVKALPGTMKALRGIVPLSVQTVSCCERQLETNIHKRTKNKAKNDKTEHGMEKCEKTKSSIKAKSQPTQSQVNPDKVEVKRKSKQRKKIQL